VSAPLSSLSPGLPFALFYGAIFLVFSVYLPFWPIWLETRGLGAAEIGLILALASWIRVVSTPMIGQLADRSGKAKTLLCLLAAGSLVSFVALSPLQGFWPLLWCNLFAALLLQAIVPLGESLAMTAAREKRFDYGRVRLWGSLTFILGTTGAGWLLSRQAAVSGTGGTGSTASTGGAEILLWLVVGGLALTLLASWLMPPQPRVERRPDLGALGRLLGDPGFLIFLLSSSLLQSSHALYYGFSALHWRDAGLSGGLIGLLWAVGVIAEVILFACARPLVARLGPVTLLMLAGLGGVIRWSLLGSTAALAPLLAAQTLHAATFGAAHLGAMYFITRRAPLGLAATAQSLYTACSGGLAAGGMILVSGLVYEQWGGAGYFLMAAVSLLGLAVAATLPKSAGEERDDV